MVRKTVLLDEIPAPVRRCTGWSLAAYAVGFFPLFLGASACLSRAFADVDAGQAWSVTSAGWLALCVGFAFVLGVLPLAAVLVRRGRRSLHAALIICLGVLAAMAVAQLVSSITHGDLAVSAALAAAWGTLSAIALRYVLDPATLRWCWTDTPVEVSRLPDAA